MREDLKRLLTTSPPACTPNDAEDLAAEYFGKHVRARMLSSERDQNFRLDADSGERYVLKISNHAERADVVDFQNRALDHIHARDASIPIPRVVAGRNGRSQFTVKLHGRDHIVRLMTWLEGKVLHDADIGPSQAVRLSATIGGLLARLGLALRGFEHSASNPPLLWDMKHAGALTELLDCIADEKLRKASEGALKDFDTLSPALATLRSQVIHNDFNPDNLLLQFDDPARISGVIDFGDLVASPLIIDVAVAAAYQLADEGDPLDGALPLIAGYHAARPLQALEIELLPSLIRTRLASSILIMSWRMRQYPQNRDYLARSQTRFRQQLVRLRHLDGGLAAARIQTACSRAMTAGD